MRRHWLDNLRWVTVVLVLIYHVFYFYNNKGVAGGIGGWDGPQYQDAVLYILYPWFMMLLFLVAGISARYALQKQTDREFRRSRTLKLLVPSTIGLFVFQWITGYYNTLTAEVVNQTPIFSTIPEPVRGIVTYLISCVSGQGPLWFAQELWIFSLLLLLLRRIDKNDTLWTKCRSAGNIWILLVGVLVWLGAQTLIQEPNPESIEPIINIYRPFSYIIPFLLGYYLFSHDEIIERVVSMRKPIWAVATISGVVLVATTFGENYTDPAYLGSVLTNLYAYSAILGLLALFKVKFDYTGRFAGYMTRSSFGWYVTHYVLIAAVGFNLKMNTSLPPVAIYSLLMVAVMIGTPLLYELLRRIPFVRWCVYGIKK